MNRNLLKITRFSTLLAALWLSACDKKESAPTPATERVPPPSAPQEEPKQEGVRTLKVEKVATASFLIDAPLEKIKGASTEARGALHLDVNDLAKTTGGVDIDLSTLKTVTFDDEGKDKKQTEHALNWLSLGSDIEAKQREENRWARFSIKKISVEGPSALAQVPETDGKRTVSALAEGEFWLHGVSANKKIRLQVEFTGPPEAPTSVRVSTIEPLSLSLKEHDVKPRDIAGKFLQGALEKTGEKIVDEVQISLELTAK